MRVRREIKITEIAGFRFGNAESRELGTGCTAVICEGGASAGLDLRGGGPATRETALLDLATQAQEIHALMLCGGSAFGLAAADGAMQFLRERQIGFNTGFGRVPLVPAAAIFDLVVGERQAFPDAAMGYQACERAFTGADFQPGCYGAGTGATVGKFSGPARMMKSGLGLASQQIGELQCGAVVVVNALGEVINPNDGRPLAGMLSADGTKLASTCDEMYPLIGSGRELWGATNTTIGCIVTNAKTNKAGAKRLAMGGHNGLIRAIRPVGTSADGDAVFSMNSGQVTADIDILATLAAEVMTNAIINAVCTAEPLYGLKTAQDFANH
jgi:L-aminopeptidase/D-esterase-like protein